MQVKHLIEENSLLCHFVSEMRDINIQRDAMRFRRNVERAGEIMAYEVSKKLHYDFHDVQTPLGIASCAEVSDQVVIATILRAGLTLHQGFLNYFDRAENAFVSAYRKYKDRLNFDIFIRHGQLYGSSLSSTPNQRNATGCTSCLYYLQPAGRGYSVQSLPRG